MSKKDFVVGLDIGTSQICCVVGAVLQTESNIELELLGLGVSPSQGLKKGVIINIEATVEGIKKAVTEAEVKTGVKISTACVSVGGSHIASFNSSGIIPIKEKEITKQDIERVINAAKEVAIPLDRETIHNVLQEYRVNGQSGILNPIGMSGVRFEAKVHIVTGAAAPIQNVIKCVNQAGIRVSDLCLESVAASEAVLCQDEKELGVVLINLGAGTSSIAIFKEGVLVYTHVLGMGGDHITNDIALGLRTPQNEAEKIKVQYGCALISKVNADETIEVVGVGERGNRILSRKLLAEIIEPRVEEIFSLIRQEVLKSGFYEVLSAGVVLTGGTALLEGISELGEFVFEMPVKRGVPQKIKGLSTEFSSPQYTTGIGLLKQGTKQGESQSLGRERNIYDKLQISMKTWIRDLF